MPLNSCEDLFNQIADLVSSSELSAHDCIISLTEVICHILASLEDGKSINHYANQIGKVVPEVAFALMNDKASVFRTVDPDEGSGAAPGG